MARANKTFRYTSIKEVDIMTKGRDDGKKVIRIKFSGDMTSLANATIDETKLKKELEDILEGVIDKFASNEEMEFDDGSFDVGVDVEEAEE